LDFVGEKMKREDVYKLIDGEREYQDQLPPSRTDGKPRSVGDYLTMFRHYLNKADEAWTDNPGDWQALDVVRKLGGIAVHCMEDHGAPPRKIKKKQRRKSVHFPGR
jgi:hypothetical protein